MTDERPSRAGFGAALIPLIVIGVIAKLWAWVLAGVAAAALMVLVGYLVYRSDQRRNTRIWEHTLIARRADEQHAQIMAGDDRGVYGLYPPAVTPTAWLLERPPRVGENWAEYLAETRKRALAG